MHQFVTSCFINSHLGSRLTQANSLQAQTAAHSLAQTLHRAIASSCFLRCLSPWRRLSSLLCLAFTFCFSMLLLSSVTRASPNVVFSPHSCSQLVVTAAVISLPASRQFPVSQFLQFLPTVTVACFSTLSPCMHVACFQFASDSVTLLPQLSPLQALFRNSCSLSLTVSALSSAHHSQLVATMHTSGRRLVSPSSNSSICLKLVCTPRSSFTASNFLPPATSSTPACVSLLSFFIVSASHSLHVVYSSAFMLVVSSHHGSSLGFTRLHA